jgi:excisionase family DNA binding protein
MMMTEFQPTVKLLLTVEEAAQALSVCRSVAYQLVLTKQISSIKIGRARRVPVTALERYIAEQLVAGE